MAVYLAGVAFVAYRTTSTDGGIQFILNGYLHVTRSGDPHIATINLEAGTKDLKKKDIKNTDSFVVAYEIFGKEKSFEHLNGILKKDPHVKSFEF